jgi:hypothetical protein
VLRAAAEKLPANLKLRFPMEEELARLETLGAAASASHTEFRACVRDATGILAGTRRGLAISEPAHLLLLNLTARAEQAITANGEAARRQRDVFAVVVGDEAGHHALADATLRNLDRTAARAATDDGDEIDLRDISTRLDLVSKSYSQ